LLLAHVVTASSGEAALASVVQHHPDLVPLDIMIPEPDGIMSGLEPSATEIGARYPRYLGADDHLTKPVDACGLRASIRRVLKRAQDP